MNILVLGGDLRHNFLAKFLSEHFNVSTLGQDRGVYNLNENLKNIDIYIFPMTISSDDIHLNTPLSDNKYVLDDILNKIDKNAIILGGNITESIKDVFSKKNLNIIDFLDREELAILNAIPTAEGTLQIILEQLTTTLQGSKMLILGNGRISKVLSKKLNALGAEVTVAARKPEDIADIYTNNMKAVNIKYINYKKAKLDVIINTVPTLILDKNILQNIDKETLLIDLASKPGGIDFEYAQKMNIKAIWALGLPGKVAPKTSAKFIFDTIINILHEKGVI